MCTLRSSIGAAEIGRILKPRLVTVYRTLVVAEQLPSRAWLWISTRHFLRGGKDTNPAHTSGSAAPASRASHPSAPTFTGRSVAEDLKVEGLTGTMFGNKVQIQDSSLRTISGACKTIRLAPNESGGTTHMIVVLVVGRRAAETACRGSGFNQLTGTLVYCSIARLRMPNVATTVFVAGRRTGSAGIRVHWCRLVIGPLWQSVARRT